MAGHGRIYNMEQYEETQAEIDRIKAAQERGESTWQEDVLLDEYREAIYEYNASLVAEARRAF
jgi:hypothetical protein